ncbi:methionine/alanine import family NSS transporter small subunit [Paraliobacillus sediminis]|nr:methionine/alanine import family NSS transporter small subunit [Paraliobacillus sediminis]
MSGAAITMLVIGVVIIWGGLAASIVHAVRASK